jgi:hypothetical protein
MWQKTTTKTNQKNPQERTPRVSTLPNEMIKRKCDVKQKCDSRATAKAAPFVWWAARSHHPEYFQRVDAAQTLVSERGPLPSLELPSIQMAETHISVAH